jgi:hypothetical protein
MQTVQSSDLAELDSILEELGTGPQVELLREHLESARIYLAGSMPAEFALSLQMAEDALESVSDPDLRARIERFIQTNESEGK